jgi:hypothetical protein
MPPAVVNTQTSSPSRRRGCTLGCLTVLLLLLLIVAGWFFVARPFLHDIAVTQLDRAMSSAVNQISPVEAGVLPHTLMVNENTLTNMLVLNTAPSDPVQHPATKISQNGVRFEFQLYGSDCAITLLPQAQTGHLIATNVTVEGIIGLILSADDIQTLLNKHLADAQARIQHTVQSVQLKDHEMDLTLGQG